MATSSWSQRPLCKEGRIQQSAGMGVCQEGCSGGTCTTDCWFRSLSLTGLRKSKEYGPHPTPPHLQQGACAGPQRRW